MRRWSPFCASVAALFALLAFTFSLSIAPPAAASSVTQPPVFSRRYFSLSSNQILNLNTSPLVIVPTPATGHAVQFQSMSCKLVFGSIAYTNAGGGALQVVYTGQTAALSAGGATGGISLIMTNSADSYAFNAGLTNAVNTANTFLPNTGLSLLKVTSNYAAGNSTLNCSVAYSDSIL